GRGEDPRLPVPPGDGDLAAASTAGEVPPLLRGADALHGQPGRRGRRAHAQGHRGDGAHPGNAEPGCRRAKRKLHLVAAAIRRLPQSEHHSFNVVGTKGILEYAAKYGVQKVVVLCSTTIYGPRPDNDNFLSEDAPLLGSQNFPGIRDLIEVDMYAQQYMWKHP